MRYKILAILLCALSEIHAADYVPKDYVWTTQSRNSSESMPCGGYDIGMNVWVEDGDLLFYIAQSGWFDENNTLLKAGRWRLHFDNQPFNGNDFCQTLCLDEGAIYVKGGGTKVRLWADTGSPMVFVKFEQQQTADITLSYESWRYQDRPLTKAECQQCSYKWVLPTGIVTRADSIVALEESLSFYHHNLPNTVFDFTVERENMQPFANQIPNPIGNLLMGGKMLARGFHYESTTTGTYASTDFKAWNYQSKQKKGEIAIDFSGKKLKMRGEESQKRSSQWWHNYWQRSWIQADDTNAEVARLVRNYELFRYMLGCNAYGQWPTKFNGGLFTFDPVFVDEKAPFTPDYRKWGGGTMTAQNQRLVYWPMLKSGDWDMMASQLDTYLRLLPAAEAWTRCHWGHAGACFSEQMENFGLPNPAEYGKHPEGSDRGVERNAWLEYEWDTALEFCFMAQQMASYAHMDITKYQPLIQSCLTFFDEHYQYLARQRSAKSLNADGKLIIYPGSGCETYKMAYNPASTIAALKAVASDSSQQSRLPDIPLRTINGDTCIAPAIVWARIQNVETPQLYPVFPWRIYGMGRKGLDIARNTYLKDPHAVEMRSSKGWKQDNIWAACIGLTDEARRLNIEKLADGPYRFPAFWDAGFDWAPDCNRGGSGMIGLQEMLLQETPGGELLLFPAWPQEWNVRFRLHATDGRVIEAEIKDGIITQKTR